MNITFEQLCILLVVGALAGWLAGLVLRRRGFGLLGNLVVGVVGSFFGRWLVGVLGFGVRSTLASLIAAFIGAVVLLWILSFFRSGSKKR